MNVVQALVSVLDGVVSAQARLERINAHAYGANHEFEYMRRVKLSEKGAERR